MEATLRQNINEWKTGRGLEPYSDKTINKYLADVRKLAPPDYIDMVWANDSEMVADKLKSYKPTTQRNYYNSLLVCLYASGMEKGTGIGAVYEAKRDLLNAEYDKMKGQNTPSQQVVLQNVTAETIDNMLKVMEKDLRTRHTHMAYAMINIYKYYQFRNDVAGMEIFPNAIFDEIEEEERKETNYLVLGKPPESMSFILNKYKTSKKYGEKCIEIENNELQLIIKNWIKYKINGDWSKLEDKVIYLFDWATGTPLTRNDISHILSETFQKYLGYSVSTTLLRKIYNNIPTDINDASDDEMKELIAQANASGHSMMTKGAVYSKK
tara:strand:+ start:363 stop:1334 length:972 start_codon:yes stop_codon:yes gene_type:complete